MTDVHWSHQRNELVGRTADRKLTAFWRNSSDKQRRKWHPHSSTFAWKIPRIEEPGRLQSMESKRVGHDKRLHYAMLKVFYDVSKGRETKSTLGYPQFRKLSLAVAKEEMETFLTLSSKKNES